MPGARFVKDAPPEQAPGTLRAGAKPGYTLVDRPALLDMGGNPQ